MRRTCLRAVDVCAASMFWTVSRPWEELHENFRALKLPFRSSRGGESGAPRLVPLVAFGGGALLHGLVGHFLGACEIDSASLCCRDSRLCDLGRSAVRVGLFHGDVRLRRDVPPSDLLPAVHCRLRHDGGSGARRRVHTGVWEGVHIPIGVEDFKEAPRFCFCGAALVFGPSAPGTRGEGPVWPIPKLVNAHVRRVWKYAVEDDIELPGGECSSKLCHFRWRDWPGGAAPSGRGDGCGGPRGRDPITHPR